MINQSPSTPPYPDWTAWATQFHFGYVIGDRTHFVQQPQERTTLVQEMSPSVQFDLLTDKPARTVTDFHLAVQSVARRLIDSVGRLLEKHSGDRPVVFLSGGWDSRALAGCLCKHLSTQEFDAFTTSYDSGNDREERFAERVAHALGLRHQIIQLGDDYYIRHAPSTLKASNYATDLHVWMQEFLHRLQLSANTVNFDGYIGDVLLRGLLQHPDDVLLSPDDDTFFRRLRVIDPSLVLSTPVANTFEQLARQELTKELEKYPAEHRMLWFALNNRGRNGVFHSPALQMQSINVALPFLAPDFLEYVLSIDNAIRLRPDFYPAVLTAIDPRLEGLPSTNDRPLSAGWSSVPIKKYSEETVSWFYVNLQPFLDNPSVSGGVIDWFSVDPSRHDWREMNNSAGRHRRLRALEMLNLYALWLDDYHPSLQGHSVLENTHAEASQKPWFFPAIHIESEYDLTAKRYLERAQRIENRALRFHWTMDVEAFPVSDIYAYHTTSCLPIERLILGDFGLGSEIDSLFHANKVPVTYFLEVFSPVWIDENRFDEIARFFKREWSDVGLHCHTFSIPPPLREELSLSAGWVLHRKDFTRVLCYGKQLIESAINSDVVAYRSGRLDVYPDMLPAIADAGFGIDSSLADGHDAFHFCDCPSAVGNSIYLADRVIEFPITTYRKQDRRTLLDFNNSSFEEFCFVVVKALELGLPAVTLLMHSWSLSSIHNYPGLAKGFHYVGSPLFHEKFQRMLDFMERLECVTLSTLRDTFKIGPAVAPGFSAADFDFDPPPLRVFACKEGKQVHGHCEVNGNYFSGDLEYAFYLMSDGKKMLMKWYNPNPAVCFTLPEGMTDNVLEVRGFVREKANPDKKLAQGAVVAKAEGS